MELIKKQTKIDFMGQRKLALVFSITLLLISIVSLVTRGLNQGLDFTGGTLVEVEYPVAADLAEARERLAAAGFSDAVVQTFGSIRDVAIRLPASEQDTASVSNQVVEALGLTSDSVQRVDFVGPKIGDELANKGGQAVIFALLAILFYIIVRFQWKFSVGAVLALTHDVIITLGVFSVFQLEFDLNVLAALLAVVGYSLNDTIVVYDRIRENFKSLRVAESIDVFNLSINQMLARTLMTSLTTLLVLLALYFLGGKIIHGFAIALLVGVVIGTYSSIYVASTALLGLKVVKQDLMPPVKEGSELDHIP